MNDQGFKLGCKVSPVVDGKLAATYEGFVHIVEGRYDDRFTAWYGAVSVAGTLNEALSLQNAQRAILQLEDGRTGEVQFLGGRVSQMAVLQGEVVGSESRTLYFVGTTNLGPIPA